MASTNKTSNLELSQFIATDTPTWLVDYNGDMEKIDAGVGRVKELAETASTQAVGVASGLQATNQTVTTLSGQVANVQNQANTTTASVNGINNRLGNTDISGIGNGTITGAISAISAQNSDLIQDLLYNSEWTAPTIYESRVKILDGGYFIKDGYCYINLRFQSVISLTAESSWTVFYNLPRPTKVYPLLCATYGSLNEDLWLPVNCAITTNGSLKFKSNEGFSDGCFSVVGFYKIA